MTDYKIVSEKLKAWCCWECKWHKKDAEWINSPDGLFLYNFTLCGKNSVRIAELDECPNIGIKGKGIITLCGSVRFYMTFVEVNSELTKQGFIVLSIGTILPKNYQDDELLKLKKMLGELHKEKIAMSDAIFVIDVDGYIGESTKNEIEFAEQHNKKVYYLSKRELIKLTEDL